MPTYKFRVGDNVFFFKSETSDYTEINTLDVGKILDLRDNQQTPYCYVTEFTVNRITEEEDGQITRTDIPIKYHFNRHQLGFIDSTVYSEDFKFTEDYYRNHQMIKHSVRELTGSYSRTDVGVITRIRRNDIGNTVWIRTSSNHMALDLDDLIAREQISPFLDVDLESMAMIDKKALNYDLTRIGNRLKTYEDEGFKICIVCNEWTYDSSLRTVAGHGFMCTDCWTDSTIDCFGCENTFYLRDINHHHYQNNDYCQPCFDERVFRCSNCAKTFENVTPLIYDNHRYCEDCYESRAYGIMSSPPRMLSRSSISKLLLPPDKLYTLNKSKTAVAIEIEAINEEVDDMDEAVYHMPRGWKDTYDGSISTDRGREFIMQPEVGDAAFNKVKVFCDWLSNEGWYTDNSCGIHVHTDAFYLGVNELKGILLTARTLEPLIYNMLPRSRSDGRYSKPMDRIDSKIILDIKTTSELCQLWYEVMNGTHASSDKYNDSRYRGFNLHSRFLHGTIEYRYHHGTINSHYINNWIMFCLAISDFGTSLFSRDKKTIDLFTDININDIRVLKDYNYTILLETMGVSNLIPYVEEMIDRNTLPPNEINDESPNWRSAQNM